MNAAAAQLNPHQALLARLVEARSSTDSLLRVVHTPALYDRPIPARHRIVFYLGHLEAFDWNLIGRQGLEAEPSHAEFDRLFAFGIDPVGGGLPDDQPADWPQLAEVEAYNRRVRDKLEEVISEKRAASASHWRFPLDLLLHTAIEHRLMHAETLAYMLHQLPNDRKSAPQGYHASESFATGPMLARMLEIPAGTATLGMPRSGDAFGWDNEFELHAVDVPAFAVDAYKVTNGEFLQFMRAGGYEDQSFWSPADWVWVKEQNISHPGFWLERKGQWVYQAMFEELPLPLDWPVYVSHAEASAFARFAGKSLPTEAQFHRAAYGTPEGGERVYPWGDAPPSAQRGNFDFRRWDPVPVASHPESRSAFGVEDTLGNGWEWTSSPFAPFQGFEPFPFYQGYSANFFDGKHYVMKGASPRTGACMLRRSFRNWFQGQYPYVYASFRCVNN